MAEVLQGWKGSSSPEYLEFGRTGSTLSRHRTKKTVFHGIACCNAVYSIASPLRSRYNAAMKIVGHRQRSGEAPFLTADEALRRAAVLQAQAELLNPYPRPRGFVFKARTREEYERWRKAQSNPRLWSTS